MQHLGGYWFRADRQDGQTEDEYFARQRSVGLLAAVLVNVTSLYHLLSGKYRRPANERP